MGHFSLPDHLSVILICCLDILNKCNIGLVINIYGPTMSYRSFTSDNVGAWNWSDANRLCEPIEATFPTQICESSTSFVLARAIDAATAILSHCLIPSDPLVLIEKTKKMMKYVLSFFIKKNWKSSRLFWYFKNIRVLLYTFYTNDFFFKIIDKKHSFFKKNPIENKYFIHFSKIVAFLLV